MRRLLILCAAFPLLATYAPAQVTYGGYTDPLVLIDNWYETFLNRSSLSDPGCFALAQELRQGRDPDAVLAAILSSNEYYAKGGSTPTGFIQDLFSDIDGRQPNNAEFQYWMQRAYAQNIDDPETRKDIAYDFLTQNPPTLPWNDLHVAWGGDISKVVNVERAHFDYHRPKPPKLYY